MSKIILFNDRVRTQYSTFKTFDKLRREMMHKAEIFNIYSSWRTQKNNFHQPGVIIISRQFNSEN